MPARQRLCRAILGPRGDRVYFMDESMLMEVSVGSDGDEPFLDGVSDGVFQPLDLGLGLFGVWP